jgi:hypothetical protein
VFHERRGAFDRSEVVGWLSVYGAVLVALMCGSPSGASDHQPAPEARPEFSGRWVLESTSTPGSEVARTLSVQQSAPQTGPRGGSMISTLERITIERDGSGAESHQIGIVGGVVGGISLGKAADGRPNGTFRSYAVKWDGNTLVFESESHTGQTAADTWTERREAWSLDAAGRLRIVITSRSSEVASRSLTLLYRRQ